MPTPKPTGDYVNVSVTSKPVADAYLPFCIRHYADYWNTGDPTSWLDTLFWNGILGFGTDNVFRVWDHHNELSYWGPSGDNRVWPASMTTRATSSGPAG